MKKEPTRYEIAKSETTIPIEDEAKNTERKIPRNVNQAV